VDGRPMASAEHGRTNALERLGHDSASRPPIMGAPIFHPAKGPVTALLDITYPVTARLTVEPSGSGEPSRLVGYVRAGMPAGAWYRSMSNRLDLLGGVAILASLVAIPLGLLLIRRIVWPLEELAAVMLRFSEGQWDVRSHIRRHDEIGRLSETFNRMAEQHKEKHERILRLNAELDKRVAYRTQQLRELASREPLTGLYNRRYFQEALQQSFSEALRYESDLSCVMIDLDDFKAVNDAFGHHIGDEVLMTTAGTIISQLRSADVAARFGGDEFVLLLPHTPIDRARVLAERIVEKFREDVAARLPQVRVGMSVGIANLQSLEEVNAESLIRSADQALYEAKAAGSNRIVTSGAAAIPTASVAAAAQDAAV